MFANWFKKMFKSSIDDESINAINNVMEVKNMLTLIAEKIEKKGYNQGIKKKSCDTALKMLEKGFHLSDIVEITGLSIEEIEELRDKGTIE